jgi:Ras-related protein Rab-8A
MSTTDYDSVQKFIIIGDSGAGKTCLLMRFCEDKFTNNFVATIGIDFKLKIIALDNKKIKV